MKRKHHLSSKVVFVLLVILCQAGLYPLKIKAEPKRTVFEGYRNCLKGEKNPNFYVIQWILGVPKILAKGPINKSTGNFKAVFEIDKKGIYKLYCTDIPIIIDGLYDYQILHSNEASLYLEPGDSLTTLKDDIGWNRKDIIGRGANNKPYIIHEFNLGDYPESEVNYDDTYINYWIDKVEKTYKDKTAVLDKLKKELPSGFYSHLLIDCKYAYYRTKFDPIVFYFSNSKFDNKAKLLDVSELLRKYHFEEFRSLKLMNDSFLNIEYYRTYIELYTQYCIVLKEKSGKQKSDYNKTKIEVINEVLPEKTKEYYFASQIFYGLSEPDSKQSMKPFYEDFIRKYPNSDYLKMISNKFNSRGDIGVGKPAPDFTLKDQYGKSTSLSSFKGRKVCLTFMSSVHRYSDIDRDYSNINRIVSNFKELQRINVFSGYDSIEFNDLTKNYPDVVHLKNNNWESAKAYNTDGDQIVYIIDEDGKILYYQYFNEARDLEYELYKLFIAKKASEKSSSNKLFIILVTIAIIILSLGLSWVIVRWRSRLIKKREEKKRKLVEMELRGIRAQMNPHFMFNSLSSIQNLINKSKVQEANLYLSKFAELLRRILNNAEKPLVSIAEEIEAIKAYCELEQLRFDFNYSIDIDSNLDIYNTEIPGMLIQPYVENAIIHGINNLTDRKGILNIAIKLNNSKLHIIIDDNGIGRKASEELKSQKKLKSNGFGLRLTQERLDLLNSQYKQAIEVAITDKVINNQAEGTNVEVRFSLTGLN